MNLWRSTVQAIVSLPAAYLIEACTYFISWDMKAKGKKRLRLGLGPADFFQLCRQQLEKVGYVGQPTNPFANLVLQQDLPPECLDTEVLKAMAEGVLLIQFGHELYNELSLLLRKNRFRVKNSSIALNSLTLKTFQSGVIPFVTSNCETLRRLDLLPHGMWERYIEFRRLSKQFGVFVQDARIPRAKTKHSPANLFLLPQRVLEYLGTCGAKLKKLATDGLSIGKAA